MRQQSSSHEVTTHLGYDDMSGEDERSKGPHAGSDDEVHLGRRDRPERHVLPRESRATWDPSVQMNLVPSTSGRMEISVTAITLR